MFKFFIATIPPTRPVLLVEDGHTSHISIEVIEPARSNNIQYLVVTTEAIASIVGRARPLSFTPVNIMAGFKKSGTFPLNPGNITDWDMAPLKRLYKQQCTKWPVGSNDTSSCDISSPSTNASCSTVSSLVPPHTFTPEQHRLYDTRYSEGYDLPDPNYKALWAINRPETLSKSTADSLVTHVSTGSMKLATSDASEALSEVLSLPKPVEHTKQKRESHAGLNSEAITLTDDVTFGFY